MLPKKIDVIGLNHLDMAGYVDGLQHCELRIQRCSANNHIQWPPRPACTECQDDNLSWVPLEGTGHLFSFTVSASSSVNEYKPLVPYVIGIIETTEGIRLLGHIDVDDRSELEVGIRLQVEFQNVGETNLPYWRLAK